MLELGWPFLRTDGFFYNLDILYGGLGIGKLQFLIKKNKKNFQLKFFFNFFFGGGGSPVSVLDPDPYWSPTSNSGSGSGKN